jgi:hypothetical protein
LEVLRKTTMLKVLKELKEVEPVFAEADIVSQDTTSEAYTVLPSSIATAAAAVALLLAKGKREEDYTCWPSFRSVFF